MNYTLLACDVIQVIKDFVREHYSQDADVAMIYQIGSRLLGVNGLEMMELADEKSLR